MTAQPTVIELGPGVYDILDFPIGIKGLVLKGSGREGPNATIVKGLKARGLWYSDISNICFKPASAQDVVVDIDGPVNGVGHGTQANTFSNCMFDGRGMNDNAMSNYVFMMNRTSGSSGQGSENMFINNHFVGAKKACVYIHGYNALNNQFIGGNFQTYDRCAIEMLFGSMHILGVGFQSTAGLRQIENDGWDIKCDSGGVGDGISVIGCRTESLRFYIGCGAQPPMIMNCNQRVPVNVWWQNYPYLVNDLVILGKKLYKCVQNHASLSITDLNNQSLWQHINFNVVESIAGTVINSNWQCGNVAIYHDVQKPTYQVIATGPATTTTVYEMEPNITDITVDATNGPVEIRLCSPGIVPHGKEVKVIRGDYSTHAVTIREMYFNNKNVFAINLTSNPCCLTFQAVGGGSFPRRWYNITPPSMSRFV